MLMADWGSGVVARLEADEDWTDALGARTDWTASPQDTAYPRSVLTTISDPRPDHFGGEEGFRQTRLQLDVYSTVSAGEANGLAELAIDILKPEAVVGPGGVGDASAGGVRFDRAGVDGPTDSGEQKETLYVFRSRVDFLLWHAKT